MTPAASRPALPAGVWVLGFVRPLVDISSEMVHRLLPMFLVGALGLSGDSSVADHITAWKLRRALGLDHVPGGVPT